MLVMGDTGDLYVFCFSNYVTSNIIYILTFSLVSSCEQLCRSKDNETQRLSLQTLELLAIENSDTIVMHVRSIVMAVINRHICFLAGI